MWPAGRSPNGQRGRTLVEMSPSSRFIAPALVAVLVAGVVVVSRHDNGGDAAAAPVAVTRPHAPSVAPVTAPPRSRAAAPTPPAPAPRRRGRPATAVRAVSA